MFANSEDILQPIGEEFEALLRFVLKGSPEEVPTAYEMECSLLRRLLGLGALLLGLYFTHQAQQHQSATAADHEGQELPYHGERWRSYWSVFGKIRFGRSYFYQEGRGWFALDAALNLPKKGVSDLLR